MRVRGRETEARGSRMAVECLGGTPRATTEPLTPFYSWERQGPELAMPAAPRPALVHPNTPSRGGRGSPASPGEHSPHQGAGPEAEPRCWTQTSGRSPKISLQMLDPKQHPDVGPKHLDRAPKPPCRCQTQSSTQMLDPNIWMEAQNLPVGAGPKASPRRWGPLGAGRGPRTRAGSGGSGGDAPTCAGGGRLVRTSVEGAESSSVPEPGGFNGSTVRPLFSVQFKRRFFEISTLRTDKIILKGEIGVKSVSARLDYFSPIVYFFTGKSFFEKTSYS